MASDSSQMAICMDNHPEMCIRNEVIWCIEAIRLDPNIRFVLNCLSEGGIVLLVGGKLREGVKLTRV